MCWWGKNYIVIENLIKKASYCSVCLWPQFFLGTSQSVLAVSEELGDKVKFLVYVSHSTHFCQLWFHVFGMPASAYLSSKVSQFLNFSCLNVFRLSFFSSVTWRCLYLCLHRKHKHTDFIPSFFNMWRRLIKVFKDSLGSSEKGNSGHMILWKACCVIKNDMAGVCRLWKAQRSSVIRTPLCNVLLDISFVKKENKGPNMGSFMHFLSASESRVSPSAHQLGVTLSSSSLSWLWNSVSCSALNRAGR